MAAQAKGSNPWLIDHDELPGWAADNQFIVTGHRRPGGWTANKRTKHSGEQDMTPYEHSTFTRCWRSMWAYWHNESINIHTHFWGAVLSVSLLILHLQHLLLPSLSSNWPHFLRYLAHAPIFYPHALYFDAAKDLNAGGGGGGSSEWLSLAHVPTENSHPPDARDIAGFASFFLGAVICLGFSATFHCCSCHSKRIAASFNKLDYIGIVFMIVGSFLPALHYGFYCHPQLQMHYTTMIVGLGGLAMYAVINPIYATPAYRPMRTAVFISLGLSAVFPVVHACAMYGYGTVSRIMGLSYVIASGAMYIVGACMYAARVPERFAPGRFDLLGASHQLFHVFILFAAFAHYIALRRSYAFWHSVEHVASAVVGGDGAGWGRESVCLLLEAHRQG
ncbi:unnamed protein product [Tilletia controversa]|uniref:Uncharacterized protein n=2 Tax=Tilletia TaxID=13289 RepID=A0A8T8TTH4_9BASI|nr:hypothetical protein CF335_g4284 [Tilletia laevis]KAE8264497.1 hypothetical protein A4X03_0g899 [Tilletia caries]CAD6907113.1 unnamed protein product [Tilletia controversa]KAE8200831.1 hypothetical protein CF336_g499 [Tilletia laevis]CAD6890425.1 unnamed protein product [Tilletia caries]